MPKTMIAPIIAVVALLVKLIFGIEIGESEQAQIVDTVSTLVFAGVALYGIVKSHVNKVNKEKSPE